MASLRDTIRIQYSLPKKKIPLIIENGLCLCYVEKQNKQKGNRIRSERLCAQRALDSVPVLKRVLAHITLPSEGGLRCSKIRSRAVLLVVL